MRASSSRASGGSGGASGDGGGEFDRQDAHRLAQVGDRKADPPVRNSAPNSSPIPGHSCQDLREDARRGILGIGSKGLESEERVFTLRPSGKRALGAMRTWRLGKADSAGRLMDEELEDADRIFRALAAEASRARASA